MCLNFKRYLVGIQHKVAMEVTPVYSILNKDKGKSKG